MIQNRRELDRVAAQTITTLRTLIARPVRAGVNFAVGEIFLSEGGDAPAVWIYYCGDNNRVDSRDESIFPGRSLKLQLPLNRLAEFDERYFCEAFPGLSLAADILKSWFAECWWKAGGWSYSVPTMLSVHDGCQ